MQNHRKLTLFRFHELAARLRGRLYPDRAPVELAVFAAPGRISFDEARRGAYRPAKLGETLGPRWSTHWFRVDLQVPREWKGREVHLLWDTRSEGCVWEEGEALQGLTGACGPAWMETKEALRPEFPLTARAAGGERRTLYIEVACNTLFGWEGEPVHSQVGLLAQAEIACFDRDLWELYWDFMTVADMAQHLPEASPRAGEALRVANAMANAFEADDRATWARVREIAAEFLAARNASGQHNVTAMGHAHIDTAWLWPLAETRRKCVRTFSTALRFMDEDPDYRFVCSQAQQFAWIKEGHPKLWERLKRRVAEGRFMPAGGTWIEPDCNLPSGESLVRQFLHGQRFFRREFGITCGEFWNPDVFGYSGALPQILRAGGIRFFLTQKLSWNQFNKPANHTFLWEGIDGSRVLTHFPPADTYNGVASVKDLVFNVSNFKDHERGRESCYLYGHGDGGGGPTRGMLASLRRMKDLEGLPRVEHRTPAEFFRRCEADLRDPRVWVGELYFELHRGTYTSQAGIKRNNRRAEGALHDAECLAALALARAGAPYPSEALDRAWKLVLLNQFHDILPGSSIREVYRDSEEQFLQVFAATDAARAAGLNALLPPADGRPAGLATVNTLSHAREEVVELPEGCPSTQIGRDGRPLGIACAPSMGWAALDASRTPATATTVRDEGDHLVLENAWTTARFTRGGALVSLRDRVLGREAIAKGAEANRFVLFEDEPHNWDAWEVDAYHLEKPRPVAPAREWRVVEKGPLRAALRFDYAVGAKSRLTVVASLDAVSRRLEFACEADWRERHEFLKVEFPVEARAPNATYEIQFGHLQRPTHFNTTWDLARFEVCAHRWADFSEPGFGVALLNDSKYGHAVHGHVMRLSLLRGPMQPDPEADQGAHRFRYALLTHGGDFRAAGVVQEAAAFNAPLLVVPTSVAPKEQSFFSVDRASVVVDTVKRAEDSDDLVLRLVESHGARGLVRMTSPLSVTRAVRCNLLEDEEAELKWESGGVTLEMGPFQIVTLKLGIMR
ncbi:MAG: alpha-mannosidase [Verrucomicrobiae bacterium]|nr:alpha-mannosidase [Verrucomicrobiae bacterium]